MKTEWHQESRIRSYETGPDGKARLATICNLLQECAASHANHLGIGVKQMQERGMIWALARIGLEVFRRPVAGEPVAVQTWLRGARGPFAMREFAVLDSSAITIARASYAWLALDSTSRRTVRPAEILKDLPSMPDRISLDAKLGKIAAPRTSVDLPPVLTRPSDVDVQFHVNNSRFIAWIEDAVGAELGGGLISWLQVNFLAEGASGQRLAVRLGSLTGNNEDNRKIVVLSRNETELVRALAVIKADEALSPTVASADRNSAEQITEETLVAACKINGISLAPGERNQALEAVSRMAEVYEKRRSVPLPNSLAPAEIFIPIGRSHGSPVPTRMPITTDALPELPVNDTDIAYSPLRHLSSWLQTGVLSSTRLCKLYLERLEKYGDQLSCVITLMKSKALEQAARADTEIQAGRYRGVLHGIPWGAKDLLDTKGTPTTWGASPFKDRLPTENAALVNLLEEAGAVLLGKLSLGALAYGDIWFGGKTKNPWNTDQGSSGSSAGSSVAAVAGLAGFCIGSETMGSIVSPSLRCGAAGLRPSFGRVPRAGAMALSWSYGKLGPICRYAEDAGLVLESICGHDMVDPCSSDLPFAMNREAPLVGVKVGYDPKWFANEERGIRFEATLETIRQSFGVSGVELVEIELPDLPYDTLFSLINVDAAAAFEDLTLSGRDDELVWQDKEAWPNTFRVAHFFPAVEYVQLQRFRRLVMQQMESLFSTVDAAISPEHSSDLLVITNSTGQPSLTIRAGFRNDGTPFGVNLWGRYLGEDILCRLGMSLERAFAVAEIRPPEFC